MIVVVVLRLVNFEKKIGKKFNFNFVFFPLLLIIIKICPDQLKWDDYRNSKCRYQNRTYRYGEQIDLIENRCKHCVCNEHWNEYDPESSTESCVDQTCPIDYYYRQNCLPIYQPDRCCPVDYICPWQQNITTSMIVDKNNNDYLYRKYLLNPDYMANEKPNGNSKYHCWLNGQQYRLGSRIHIRKNLTEFQIKCAMCQCKIPPLMTCVVNDRCLINSHN